MALCQPTPYLPDQYPKWNSAKCSSFVLELEISHLASASGVGVCAKGTSRVCWYRCTQTKTTWVIVSQYLATDICTAFAFSKLNNNHSFSPGIRLYLSRLSSHTSCIHLIWNSAHTNERRSIGIGEHKKCFLHRKSSAACVQNCSQHSCTKISSSRFLATCGWRLVQKLKHRSLARFSGYFATRLCSGGLCLEGEKERMKKTLLMYITLNLKSENHRELFGVWPEIYSTFANV